MLTLLRGIGRGLWQLSVTQKICLVLAGISVWFFSRLKIEPLKLPSASEWFGPTLLVGVGLLLLLLVVRGVVQKRRLARRLPAQTLAAPTEPQTHMAWLNKPEVAAPKKKFSLLKAIIILALIVGGLYYLKKDSLSNVDKLGPGYYRVMMSTKTGWDPTLTFHPGDQLFVVIEQPWYARIGSTGKRIPETVAGIPINDRLATPQDLRDKSQVWFYTAKDLPLGGLLFRSGDDGPIVFMGQGGHYTCPGKSGDSRQMLYIAINLGNTIAQKHRFEGHVVFTIKVVHSLHPKT